MSNQIRKPEFLRGIFGKIGTLNLNLLNWTHRAELPGGFQLFGHGGRHVSTLAHGLAFRSKNGVPRKDRKKKVSLGWFHPEIRGVMGPNHWALMEWHVSPRKKWPKKNGVISLPKFSVECEMGPLTGMCCWWSFSKTLEFVGCENVP